MSKARAAANGELGKPECYWVIAYIGLLPKVSIDFVVRGWLGVADSFQAREVEQLAWIDIAMMRGGL